VVSAYQVKDYSFSWFVPDVARKYVEEVDLVSPQVTAYDPHWFEAV
jgi:hypothetical protein